MNPDPVKPPKDDDELIPLEPESAIELPPTPVRRGSASASGPSRPCPGCGYEMRGLPIGVRCPECGAFTRDTKKQRGPALLLHAGRPTVTEVLVKLIPVVIAAFLALALVVLGGVGVLFRSPATYAYCAAAAPLLALGLLLLPNRLTRPEELADPGTQRARIALVLASLFWIAHAFILGQLFVTVNGPTPLTPKQDARFTIGLACSMIAATIYYFACAARFRSLERWLTSDNEGSLFTGGAGFFLFGPALIAAFVYAGLVALQGPLVRVAWRLDRAIILLATIDLAWRSWRALRLTMHSRRHALETLEREERIESDREARVSELLRRVKG